MLKKVKKIEYSERSKKKKNVGEGTHSFNSGHRVSKLNLFFNMFEIRT